MLIENKRHHLYRQVNELLNKVKLESKDGKELLTGLLNINLICKSNGLFLAFGILSFDAIIRLCPAFVEVFNINFFCKNAIKHFSIVYDAETANKGSKYTNSPGSALSSNYGVEALIPPLFHNVGMLKLAEAKKTLSKIGTFSYGSTKHVKYHIDTNFNLTQVIGKVYQPAATTLCNFGISVTNETLQQFYLFTIKGNDESTHFRIQLKSEMASILPIIYTVGLIGNLNLRSDVFNSCRTPHELFIGILIRRQFDKVAVDHNDHWLLDEKYDINNLKSFLVRSEERGRGMSNSYSEWW